MRWAASSWSATVGTEAGNTQPEPLIWPLAATVAEAVEEILGFYSSYHSMRFVGRRLVMRLNREPSDAELEAWGDEFSDIVTHGGFERTTAAASEIEDGDAVGLARVAFRFDRSSYARLRRLIDRVNRRPNSS